jgi:hypothetical protein
MGDTRQLIESGWVGAAQPGVGIVSNIRGGCSLLRQPLSLLSILLNKDAQNAVFRSAVELDLHDVEAVRGRDALRGSANLFNIKRHKLCSASKVIK